MKGKDIYNKAYYTVGCGGDYHDKNFWEPLFKNCAQRIAQDLRPKTVLDVGCAFGYVVEYLRDLGIEAWGIDVSDYAVSQAREDIKPYLRTVSATEPLPDDIPQTYDLVLNIEVLEHMYEEEGLKALERLCGYSERIFFSSSAEDITERTHVNVQQPEYWAEKFAKQGFYKNLQYDTGYLSKYSCIYERGGDSMDKPRIVRDYEHALRLNKHELEKEKEKLLIEIEKRSRNEKYYESETERLREELVRLNEEARNLRDELVHVTGSRVYRGALKMYAVRDRLLPKGSRRREAVKSFAKIFKKKAPTGRDAQAEPGRFYSKEEEARQIWCRERPIAEKTRFSVIVPLYNTPPRILEAMINSVTGQIYGGWELCLVNASPEKKSISQCVEKLASENPKIKYRELEKNLGISDNTMECLKMAEGDFITLLDHDDMIAPNALYEYALALEEDPDIDFFYSDKDMISEDGSRRLNTYRKPAYSPETMLSANYMTHFCAVRKSVFEKTGGFDKLTDGAQDWDMFLKIMEVTDKIKHVGRILYHWRIISTSVSSGIKAKPYVLEAQLKALNDYIKRKGWKGKIFFPIKDEFALKVVWNFKNSPTVAAVILSETGDREVPLDGVKEVLKARKDKKGLKDEINGLDADVLLFIDADECISLSGGGVSELASWALHPEIAFVAPQLKKGQTIMSCGLIYDEKGKVFDMFMGKPMGYYGVAGGSYWYRNFSLFRGTCVAVEKSKWLASMGYSPDLGYFAVTGQCVVLAEKGYRNVYDCWAYAETSKDFPMTSALQKDFHLLLSKTKASKKDKYFVYEMSESDSPSKLSGGGFCKDAQSDKYSQDAFILSEIYDFNPRDLAENRRALEVRPRGPVKTMIWFLPEFDYVFYAGLYTIFRTADYLARVYGVKHSFAFLSSETSEKMMERVAAGFPGLGECEAFQLKSSEDLTKLANYDASVCTLWTTAYYSLKFNGVGRKFYFIQDFEPLFYPAGSVYAQAEVTYKFGFYGIANTYGLKKIYESEYGGKSVSLDPSVDTKIFYPDPGRVYDKERYTVFFYGRPGHPRNGFELGAGALKLLKKSMGDKVRIVTAGANYNPSDYGLEGVVENLGRLKIEETGDLYRQCDAGLIMMYTRHPSYLPYEMMACGCCVVSNDNEYTRWFLTNGENSVTCEPSAGSVAEAIEGLLKDPEKRRNISVRAAKQILENNPDWDASLEKVAKFINEPEEDAL